MRIFIEWRDDWLLGIPGVDREHQELAQLFNQVAKLYACAGEKRMTGNAEVAEELVGLLNEMGEHVRSHFRNEEALMRESGYPELEDHSFEHASLLAEYAELLRELESQGLGCLDTETLGSLKTWLIGHVANADSRFGEFYRERSVATSD